MSILSTTASTTQSASFKHSRSFSILPGVIKLMLFSSINKGGLDFFIRSQALLAISLVKSSN